MNLTEIVSRHTDILPNLPSDGYIKIDWELRHDFDALALLGPTIYHNAANFYILWDSDMMSDIPSIPIRDYGKGKRKFSIGILPVENQKKFEDAHKIRLHFHLV